jgi:hypothetical protein
VANNFLSLAMIFFTAYCVSDIYLDKPRTLFTLTVNLALAFVVSYLLGAINRWRGDGE